MKIEFLSGDEAARLASRQIGAEPRKPATDAWSSTCTRRFSCRVTRLS